MIRIFKHYMPKALFYLGIIESLILLLALYVGATLVLPGQPVGYLAGPPIFPNALIFLLVMIVIMTALGLYQREFKEGDWGHFLRLGISMLTGLAVMSLIFHVMPSLSLRYDAVGLTFLFAIFGLTLARLSYLKLMTHRGIRKRVLVIGSGGLARAVARLAEDRNAGFEVVGCLPVGEGQKEPNAKESIAEVAKRLRVEEIVIAMPERRGLLPAQDLLDCKVDGVNVIDLPDFFERETGRVQLETLHTSWLIFSDGFKQSLLKSLLKRFVDVAASLLLLVLTWPIMLITAALISWEDRGPVFYSQERVGQDGKTFTLTKFRSMRIDAESDGRAKWAQKNDDRVTRVGRVIRKIRVDELPQLFNVLRGEMSFVGPRPERPQFVAELAGEIPYYTIRHAIKPGITGWAQVRYPYGASVQDAIEKLQYDLYYVKNHSIFLDLVILFQTVRVIAWNEGAR